MKKIIVGLLLLALSLGTFSCGGGAGSPNSPRGENPGTPSIVQLQPSHFIAQTNTVITLHAKVLDGNGAPVRDANVRFTNLSPVGVLSAADAKTDSGGLVRIAADKKTNSSGIATVTLKSTSSGFATIQAEVNQGVAIVRDRRTVFFTTTGVSQLTPTLTLAVDGNDADQIFNENEDFNLLETTGDNAVLIKATLANAAFFISGSQITFAADRPYRIGTDPDAACSDGSANCDVRFPAGVTAFTNSFGEATITVLVEPSTLTSLSTTLNILAQADVGAFNMITLFLGPVTVQDPISVSANPTTVESGGTSTISAGVLTNAGTPVPDGTTVNFSVSSGPGSVEPFAQTTDGIAEAQYSAPEVAGNTLATIRARAGSASGTVTVTVTPPSSTPTPTPTPTPDTTSPTVTSTNPAGNATGVAHPTPVTITFSENIDCSTVTPATVTITPTVTWNLTSCTGNTVIFNGATLASTLYTINVGTGVKDLAGNVAVARVFSFTTGP